MADNNVTDDDLAALIALASEATSAFIGGDIHRYFALIEHADDYTLMSPRAGRWRAPTSLSGASTRWRGSSRAAKALSR